MKYFHALTFLISSSLYAQARLPKALVYGGYGACKEGCITAAVDVARKAGYATQIVYPKYYHPSVLDDVAVWIQPGGYAVEQSESMGLQMMEDVKNFVREGGGFVGFCAGAFIATAEIGTSGKKGYGMIPGKTKGYRAVKNPNVETMTFGEIKRELYWEGGPYFILTEKNLRNSEIMGRYESNNLPVFVRAPYGKGRAYVTGAHPEAPQWWRNYARLFDGDGLDYSVTTEMILWATKQSLQRLTSSSEK
ncbi:MAG TPA: BPL-N domain-containing protein [Bacteriovoracaceae bacterium]|nr:BPL-N domain-containing protein [Bacteriovoracaceae bacterium]